MSSSETRASRVNFFVVVVFLTPDFHELWPSVMSTSRFTKLSYDGLL